MQGSLERLDIYGWELIEPTLLANLVNRFPILLLGLHGETKTRACQWLARSMLRDSTRFVTYNAKLLTPEKLQGFLNPERLREGAIDFIQTKKSAYGANAIHIDEINRTNMDTGSSLMELVQDRTLDGEKTEVQYVFASANPPKLYGAYFMDLAFASRFSIVETPSASAKQSTLQRVLRLRRSKRDAPPSEAQLQAANDLRLRVLRARKHTLSEPESTAAETAVLRIAQGLQELPFYGEGRLLVSSRQYGDMTATLRALMQLRNVCESEDAREVFSIEAMTMAMMSHIPEMCGVTRKGIVLDDEHAAVKSALSQAIASLQHIDHTDLLDHLKKVPQAATAGHWAMMVSEMLSTESLGPRVRKVARITAGWLQKGKLPAAPANDVLTAAVRRMIELEPERVDTLRVGADRGKLLHGVLRALLTKEEVTE